MYRRHDVREPKTNTATTFRGGPPPRVALCALALALCGLAGGVPVVGRSMVKGPVIEIEERLWQQLAEDETTGYAIFFRERPDLSAAYAMDWIERGRFVVDALRATADASQARVQEYLHRSDVQFQSFWIDNVIVVERSDLGTFTGLQRFGEIEALRADPGMRLIEPESWSPQALKQSLSVEPNIAHVRAPDVWALGYEGEGIVVGGIDTGVRLTHQSLVTQYRGFLGGGNFDHNHNWWDPAGSTNPVDAFGHGTHTMGTAVGDDGGSNQIGMAPGARWIACRGCPGAGCPAADLLTCGQFMAAPWDLGQQNADPNLRPHVVNNSWGNCETFYNPWYQGVVDSWHALGVVPVFANGNASNCGLPANPPCNTVGNPARYGNVLGIGSTGTSDGQYASHSLKGPSDDPWDENPLGFPTIKPNVAAPGSSIRSASAAGDGDYQFGTGTSMSAPHVAGLVALLWEAAPCLVGDYVATAEILMAEATAVPFASQCGGEGPGNVPNHATGWGEIDALNVIEAGLAACHAKGPGLWVTPSLLQFGVVPVSQLSERQSITLRSVGSEPVTVRQVIVEGSLPSDPDAVPFALAGGSCERVPFTLEPDATCTFDVLFFPQAMGASSSVLTVVSDAPLSPHISTLQGAGTGFLEFDPASLHFGDVEVGETSPPRKALLQSLGTAAATGLDFSLTGGDGFQVDTSACGDVLSGGASCPVVVTFTPTEAGPGAASLQLTSNHPAGFASLDLGGSGLAAGEPRTILASRASGPGGEKGDAGSFTDGPRQVSGDGRYVVFRSGARNLHPEMGGGTQVFARDLQTHETILVSRGSCVELQCAAHASISADGRRVAFISPALDLHPDDTDVLWDTFVFDLQSEETILVSRASGPDGAKDNAGASGWQGPSISGDGRRVAFVSAATNLHPDATDGIPDVYVRDLETHETILVSRAAGPDGVKGNDVSFYPSISADGRYVAFESRASNLHQDDPDGGAFGADVYVRDLETHELILVSRASGADGQKGNGQAIRPSISSDGRSVAFVTTASNIHPDKTDTIFDAFVRNLDTHESILVSRAAGPSGAKANSGAAQLPSVSADGRYVSFVASARNLHPDLPPPPEPSSGQLFLRDLVTHEMILVSRASGAAGELGNRQSRVPSISGDGRYVAFWSDATNLHPDATDELWDVYVRDWRGSDPAEAELSIWPGSLDFGTVFVGETTDPLDLTLTGAGTGTVTVTGVSDPGAPFVQVGGTCGSPPFSLSPAASCTLAFAFSPTSEGPADSSVTVTSDDETGPHTIPLTGEALPAGDPDTIFVNRASGAQGAAGNQPATAPSISADGRYEAFQSNASNLHPDATDALLDIYVRDLEEHVTDLVSRASGPDGVKGNASSTAASVSADGRFVAFQSNASNLHPDATDSVNDIYVRDLQEQVTQLVSRASGPDGVKGNANSTVPWISADGRYVAFQSNSNNLHPDAGDIVIDIYVRDLLTHETILVSRASGADGVKGNFASQAPSISHDGRYVAFQSNADNLHPDDTDLRTDIYVRDLSTHETILVSRASGADGVKGDFASQLPSISGDARHLAFHSQATNLHPDSPTNFPSVFVRDLESHETVLVSRASGPDGGNGDASATNASISAGGRYVAYQSNSTNLHPDATDSLTDVYLRDLLTHETILISRASGTDGPKSNGTSSLPSVSGDGSRVAFMSLATNLDPDTTALINVFARDWLVSVPDPPVASHSRPGVAAGRR